MYLEKPKHLIIWNGVLTKCQQHAGYTYHGTRHKQNRKEGGGGGGEEEKRLFLLLCSFFIFLYAYLCGDNFLVITFDFFIFN
jgi:hypothetical protein